MSHTPGPWTLRKCPCGHPACNQYLISVQGSVGFDEPDACLIAAAPDLLEALKAIVNSDMAMRDEDEGRSSPELDAARAAIAKAEGRQ